MLHFRNLYLTAVAWLLIAVPAASWPATTYTEIFLDARQTLPAPLQLLLEDMEPILHESCRPAPLAEAVATAISDFSDKDGNLHAAVAAMRDAGCAAAAMNDPNMDVLVESHRSRFAVVFYGWHPAIEARDFETYLAIRTAEVEVLAGRFERTSELPNRSDMVELSPEFGMASVAYSHAVTDVANVWLHIWLSVNGSF